MNRQRVILFCLLILLALAIIWSFVRMPRQKTAPLKYAPGKQTAPATQSNTGSAPDSRQAASTLRLDLLDQQTPDFRGYRRNIFKPVFVDEVKVAKLRMDALKRRPVRPPPPPPPSVPIQPAVTAPVRPELAKFTFLGFLLKDKRRTIFLSKDREIILVKKGDIFAGRYEASSITDQKLTIRVTDTGEEIVIPLVEYSSLRPTD